MKKTTIFLPKFLYAAIFIFAVFGLVVFGAGGGNKTANQNLAAGGGGTAQMIVNQEQGESNRQQTGADITAIDKFVNLFQSHDFLSRLIANIKKSITARTLAVKLNRESENGVEMKAAAATSVEKAAYTLKAWDDRISSFIDPENDSTFSGWLSILASKAYAGVFLNEGRITII